MPSKILIDLEDALAWARGERHLRVRLPDGSLSEMSLIEYRRVCELQKRLRAHKGRPKDVHQFAIGHSG